MASTRLDLPDPVAPVKANRSVPLKSTTTGSLNEVNPSSSSRSGRIGVLQQLGEQGQEPCVVDGLLGEVLAEQLVRRSSPPAWTVSPRRAAGVGWRHHHVDG